jgi:hypothetical protein
MLRPRTAAPSITRRQRRPLSQYTLIHAHAPRRRRRLYGSRRSHRPVSAYIGNGTGP